jgi:hypothetical protein
MAPPPTATTVAGLFKLTLLDHLVATVLPLLLAWWIASAVDAPRTIGLALGAIVAFVWLRWLRRGRKRRDVARDMLEVAAGVGEVTGVPLVLMGHSHHGTLQRMGDVVYANSGSWLDGSHLIVRRDPGSGRLVTVELRHWRNGGTTRVDAMDVPQSPARTEADLSESSQPPTGQPSGPPAGPSSGPPSGPPSDQLPAAAEARALRQPGPA